MSAGTEPGRPSRNWLRSRFVCLCVLLIGLASLRFTAFEQWSGPTPGWAATAFSCVGFLVFCDWLGNGAPANPGPHDPDLSRYELVACAAGFLANIFLVAGLVLGLLNARRLARTSGRVALCLGLAAIVLLMINANLFELKLGGYLWLGSMSLLAFSRLNTPNDPSPTTQE
jgi:hypothetical protein